MRKQQHLLQMTWWPCGRAASGRTGFEAFSILQGLKIKTPDTKGLMGLADCCKSFLLVLSLSVHAWILLRLGSKHGSCSLAGVRAWASLCKEPKVAMSEALLPFRSMKEEEPSPGSSNSGLTTPAWIEICNPVMGGHSQVCTLSMAKETPKSQNVKSYVFSFTRQVFFPG